MCEGVSVSGPLCLITTGFPIIQTIVELFVCFSKRVTLLFGVRVAISCTNLLHEIGDRNETLIFTVKVFGEIVNIKLVEDLELPECLLEVVQVDQLRLIRIEARDVVLDVSFVQVELGPEIFQLFSSLAFIKLPLKFSAH